MNANDAIALERWIERRDADAFRDLVGRYSGLVFGASRRVLGNAHDAEEIAQECFQALAGAERPPAPYLGPWLHRIATNLALKRVRTDIRRRAREERFAGEQPDSARISWNDVYCYVDEAIAALPDELREPLVAHYLEGASQSDIARAMGMPRQTVTNRVHRGIDQIRTALRRHGIAAGAASLAALFEANLVEAAPATLTAALGKLALAGTNTGGVTTTAVAVGGGMLLLKKALVAAVILTVGGTVAIGLHRVMGHGPSTVSRDDVGTSPRAAHVPVDEAKPDDEARPVRQTAQEPGALEAGTVIAAVAQADEASPGGTISGRLYDVDTGHGLAGVRIVCQPDDQSNTFRYAADDHPRTDAEGRFRIEGLESGAYKVLCTGTYRTQDPGDAHPYEVSLQFAGNESIQRCRVEPEGQVADVDFRAIVGTTVAGVVRDMAGAPVPGADVTINPKGAWLQTETRDDGTFKAGGCPPTKELRVCATKGNKGTGFRMTAIGSKEAIPPDPDALASGVSGPFTVPEEGLAGLELCVRPGAAVSGVFLDKNGAPVPEARIMIRSYEPHHMDSRMGTTDQEGRFAFSGISEGKHDVAWNRPEPGERREPESWNPSKAEVLKTLELRWGQRVEGLAVRMAEKAPNAEGLSISGRVTDVRGRLLAGAKVRASWQYTNEGGTATTGTDGTYRIGGLVEGAHRVRVTHAEYSQAVLHPVEAGSQDVDFVLQDLGSISGRVVYADSGLPVTVFSVRAMGSDKAVRTEDDEGRFRIEKARAGTNSVHVEAEGYAEADVTVTVAPGRETTGVEVRLERGDSVEGVVVTETGDLVPNARIYQRSMPSDESQRQTLAEEFTDSEGRFRLENVKPKLRKVTAWHPEHGAGVAACSPGDSDLHIVLVTSVGSVEGIVTLAGVPANGAKVSLTPENILEPMVGNISAKSAADGTYKLTEVPPGAYKVSVSAGPERGDALLTRNLSRRVVVEANMVTEANLDIPARDAAFEGQVLYQGSPPASAFAMLTVATPDGEELYVVQADQNGMLTLDGVAPGSVSLRVSAVVDPPFTSLTKTVTLDIASGSSVHRTIVFDGAAVVSGKISGADVGGQMGLFLLNGHLDIPEFDVTTLMQLMPSMAAQTQPDASGNLDFPPVNGGDYTVLAYTMDRTGIRSWGAAHCIAVDGEEIRVSVEIR
jgi:RNA polymerase sigma factor (sigma-70 family)